MPAVHIRAARRNEAAAIAAISRDTFYTAFAHQNTPEDMELYLSTHFKPEQIEQEFYEANAAILVAEVDGNIAGYAKVSSKYYPELLKDLQPLELERLYVLADYQGQKVGALLMERCLAYAKQTGKNVIWLGVWEHNHGAIRFYQRYGFEKFDEHDFVLGKDVQRDWMMKRELQS